jgi:hypothetical protein
METISAIIPLVPLFYSLYGLLLRKRFFFLLGYTVFAFFIMVSEFNFFLLDNNFTHILIASLFSVQLLISYPNSLKFDGTVVFRSRSCKNCLSLALINIVGVFVVLDNPGISVMGVVYHSIFAVLPFIFYFLTLSNRIPLYEAPAK